MSQQRFDLGLTCAGAVSAGAYTAGVVSFLFDALNALYAAKDANGNPLIPHEVKLKVMTGASAGGMCTALTGVSICDGNIDKFKASWVKMIDMKPLLDTADLQNTSMELTSILNSKIIDDIAEKSIAPSGAANWAPWLEDSIDLMLTVTNLNGITYKVEMNNQSSGGYYIKNHSDYLHFRLCKPGTIPSTKLPGIYYLDATSKDPAILANWKLLKEAAKATGAFPLALASRKIKRKSEDYLNRQLSELQKVQGFEGTVKPELYDQNEFEYLYVDGGMTNNEPFQLAHDVLTKGKENNSNPREPETANAGVIMVDPFPDFGVDFKNEALKQEVLNLTGTLVSSLRNQSKFKLDELLLAISDKVFSRFLIAPTRRNFPAGFKKNPKQISHVAGSALSAFGGFISESFRQHDFDLGRRNCQQFLRFYLKLDESNPLFKNWSADLKAQFRIVSDEKNWLPIIPLVTDSLKVEINEPTWPSTSQQNLKDIEGLINKRAISTIEYLMAKNDLNMFVKFVANLFKKKVGGKISDAAMKKINTELEELCLISK